MSPLALQYWQFAKGNDLFRELFGRSPTTYQCQENSLTPQMPELLRHFGYDRALHITQNRGEAPADTREFIRWSSPAGHGVPALTAPDPRLTRKGNNYFLDLPLIHKEYGRRTAPMHYVNFQDLGYVPFRIQMMRAHHYAPVWGRFCSSAEVFPDVRPEALPAAAYDADAYKFSANLFYSDETNVNALSHYRRVHALNGRRRQLLLAAQAAGKLPALCETINSVIENILLLEAHDCCVVQGQRRGEFHSRNTLLNPPYSRETLVQKVDELAAAVDAVHEGAIGGIAGAAPALLFNAAEVPLSFGRVRYPERFAGGGSVPFVGAVYAAGPFPAFDAVAPAAAGPLTRHELPCVHGTWTLQAADGRVGLEIGGRQARFAPVDRRHGAFELRGAELKRAGSLLFAEFWWTLSAPRLQAVVTSVVLSEAGDYAEVGARYAPRLDFDVRSKWTDYLALEWSLGATLDEVVRFNPNVSAPTREDRVVSPCVLEVAAAACGGLAFLNEGEAAYEVDRGGGRVRWLFHVACETVHERRMAVAFGGGDAFRLSRAWGQGLLPVAGVADRFLAAQDWRGISVEDCLDADTLLVSNLLDREHTVDLGAGAAGRPLVSENTQAASTLRLRPFEIGLIRRQRKEHG